MKYQLLSFFLITSSFAFGIEQHEGFKVTIDNAEKELRSMKYCIKNQKTDACRIYFATLFAFYNTSFYLNASPNSSRLENLCKEKADSFRDSIEGVKNESLQNKLLLDVQKETNATLNLFKEASKKAYEQLPFYQKIILKIEVWP